MADSAILARTNDGFGEILILTDEGAAKAYRAVSTNVTDYGLANIKPGNKLGLEAGDYHWVRLS
jgi:hypothetical protein